MSPTDRQRGILEKQSFPPDAGGDKSVAAGAPKDDLVEFDGPGDPMNPQNWSTTKKLFTGAIGCYTCLCSTFASAVLSPAGRALGEYFHVSEEVATLATSLYIFGYALGPLIWGPLSELQGRKLPIVIAMLGFTIFSAGTAVGKDLQTVMICRFFAGAMGSCPLSVVAGLFADMYDHAHRGTAIAVFAMCIFIG